ncbi:MAG: cobalt transporter CbiM [Planctomycetota bacterium]
MHIPEGALSGSIEGIVVLSAAAAATAAGTALGLRKMDYERVPQVAMLSSVFFVASLVHVPLGPTSVHLVLNGLVGLLLGWAAFPALLVALFLQAILFGHGGLTVLGINTLTMALPAVACYYLFHRPVQWWSDTLAFWAAFAAGSLAVLLAAGLTASALWVTGKEFELFAGAVLAFHVAVAAIEGLVTGSVVLFLRKVRPEMLEAPLFAPGR